MEIQNDTEMETITYQGREIEAELMGEIDGQHMWGRRDAVSIALYRDAEGFYYLAANHNRQFASVDELADRAESWVRALTPTQTLRKAGLSSSKCWLRQIRKTLCSST